MKKPLLLGIILTVCVVIGTFVFSLGYPGGMVSYWKFDEGAESTVSDSVDANHGTIYGAQWTTDGMVNGALSFDGSDDYVEVPTSANLDITDAITLEAWVNPQTVGAWKRVIVKGEDITPSDLRTWAYILGLSQGGGVYFALFAGNSQTYINGAVTKIPTNTWTHIAGTWDGGMMRIYVNGIEQSSEKLSFSGPINVVTHPLKFGIAPHSGVPYAFNGKIDEAAIYNRALSAAEIQQHYENVSYEVQCVTPPSGMVSWWDGDTVSETTAFDIQNGNHGTMVGDVSIIPGKVGNAFSFDGLDDYVEVLDDPTLDITDGITLEAWIKADSTQTGRASGIITKDDLSDGRSYNLHLSSASSPAPWALRMRLLTLSDNGIIDGTTDLRDNTWHHVAGTWNGSIMNLYVDGILQNSRSSAGSISITSTPLIIGDFGTSLNVQYGFSGLIDEVEIFNRALSQSEIQAIYLAGSAGKCKVAPVIEVTIDIKPDSDPNSINLGENGLLPVAILGSQDFDVTKIDPGTIGLGGVVLATRGGGSKKAPKLAYSFEYVNDDDYIDMVTFFDVQDLVNIEEGGLTENSTELVLTATLDIEYGGTPIEGSDSVRVLH